MHRWDEMIGETLWVPVVKRYTHKAKHHKPGVFARGLYMMSLFAISM